SRSEHVRKEIGNPDNDANRYHERQNGYNADQEAADKGTKELRHRISVSSRYRWPSAFQLFNFFQSGGYLSLVLLDFFRIVHLLLGAGETLLQLGDFLAEDFDAFFGFFIHECYSSW